MEKTKLKINDEKHFRSINQVRIKTYIGGDIASQTNVECYAYDMLSIVEPIRKLVHGEIDSILIEPVNIYHQTFFSDF